MPILANAPVPQPTKAASNPPAPVHKTPSQSVPVIPEKNLIVPLMPNAPPSEKAVTAASTPPDASKSDTDPALALPSARAASANTPLVPVAKDENLPITPPRRSEASQLNTPEPPYPAISRRLAQQGRVVMNVYILSDGHVGEIKLERSSGYARLDEAALEAVRHWLYEPARRGREAIPYWYVQAINFKL